MRRRKAISHSSERTHVASVNYTKWALIGDNVTRCTTVERFLNRRREEFAISVMAIFLKEASTPGNKFKIDLQQLLQ